MNIKRLPVRTVAALGAATALTLAGCGGDDDADQSAVTTTQAPAPADEPAAETSADDDAPATQPSSISFDAQDGDGTTVVIASIDLPAPGFIAVHGDGGGSPGPVIGNSELLPAGTSTNVVVTLGQPLTADATVFPMVHIDMNSNGVYEFAPPDVTTDGPGVTAAGDVAVVGATVTVTGGDSAAPTGDDTITIEGFAFSGVSEIAAGAIVTITNNDGASHTFSADDGSFDAGTIGPGESVEFTFTTAGEFTYHCNIHPSMTGKIVVTG